MKARFALVFLAFTCAPAQAAVTFKTSVIEIFTTLSSEVVEGTVLNARLLTYEQGGQTKVCGAAYEMLVDELEGKAPVRCPSEAKYRRSRKPRTRK